ncbi:hypothetical protein KKF47_01780, partial [Patescibacteria group bacterium]|nr:hypothetical protein [Patescibacteria group bacterium]
ATCIIITIIVLVIALVGVILAYQYYGLGPRIFKNEVINQEISEKEAIDLIHNLPEVKEWLALFTGPGGTSPITGGRPAIEIDSKSAEEYTIHVYEALSDHTATFNWYSINLKTREIKPIF